MGILPCSVLFYTILVFLNKQFLERTNLGILLGMEKKEKKKEDPSSTISSSRNRRRHSRSRQNRSRKKQDFQKVSDHFEKKDFMCKSGLSKKLRISAGLVGCLEYIQSKVKTPISIVKGYECAESSEKNRRLKRNYHMQGLAVNIVVADMSLEAIFEIADTVEEFTIIGINYDEGYIHLCTVKGRERERWVIKNGEETPYVAPAG